MKCFCFTVDDNIRFLKELTENPKKSIFGHPYLAMYKRLHEKYDLKVQLNLFYEMPDFDLTMATDRYKQEFQANSHWLKMSFHSKWENVRPYEFSGYEEVYTDCKAVNDQILRFAGPETLGKTTTIHYCRTTEDGLRAMKDMGAEGLLGLFDTMENPRTSYSVPDSYGDAIRAGAVIEYLGVKIASIDMVINTVKEEQLIPELETLLDHDQIRVMIHEQYFYPDYPSYQENFQKKLETVFAFLGKTGYKSHFFEDMLNADNRLEKEKEYGI